MEFEGLTHFRTRVPNSNIEREGEHFDLHNDAGLREFGIDYRHALVRLTWTLTQPAWMLARDAKLSQRKTVAGLALTFSGVSQLSVTGLWFDSASDASGLDFFEYSELSEGSGEMRFVMNNDAEAVVVATKCQLRTLEKL